MTDAGLGSDVCGWDPTCLYQPKAELVRDWQVMAVCGLHRPMAEQKGWTAESDEMVERIRIAAADSG